MISSNPNSVLATKRVGGWARRTAIHGRPACQAFNVRVGKGRRDWEEEIAAIHSDFGSCLTPVSLMEFQTKLAQQATNLIGLHRAQVGPGHRLTNGVGIGHIVLVAL